MIIKKKKGKISSKSKRRMLVSFCFFSVIIAALGFNFLNYIKEIREKEEERIFLEEKIVELRKKEDSLKTDIQRLEDPDYIARYAREKYLLSKDDEIIIKLQ